MALSSLLLGLLLITLAFAVHRPINIFMYQYIPDLGGDFYAGLVTKLQDRFFEDTGRNVSLTYSFDYDVYTHETVGVALTTGGFDLLEADASNIDYLSTNDFVRTIPHAVDLTGYTEESIEMSKDADGIIYMVPSYSCVNVMLSYDSSLNNVNSADELVTWVTARMTTSLKIGWSGDLGNVWDMRLTYVDGYLDTHKHDPLYPDSYSDSLDSDIVDTLKFLRNSCVDRNTSPATNPCLDLTYFFNTDNRFFGDFASGRSVILQGFPEYVANILALNPVMPTIVPAQLGEGNKNYVFTNGFVVSKANCGHNCISTAVMWLNWQKVNHGLITALGLDLATPKPRYLMWSWEPFYDLPQVKAYPLFDDLWKIQKKGIALETLHILETEAAQFAALTDELVTGYVPT